MESKKLQILSLLCLILAVCLISMRDDQPLRPYIFEKVRYVPAMPINMNNPVTYEGRELGRMLFYDPILSNDSSISCATCHNQEFAFSNGPLQFSIGVNGDTSMRNTPGLFNLAWYNAYFWDGRAKSIEDQVFDPIRSHEELDMDWKTLTMRLAANDNYSKQFALVFNQERIDSNQISFAIAQFERTLLSFNSKFDRVLRGEDFFSPSEYKGFELMNDQTKGNCLHCHRTDGNGLGTNGKFSNNGLTNAVSAKDFLDPGLGGVTGKESDMGLFKVPSLRNIALTAPYMHDGRFNTLEEVLSFYASGLKPSYNIDTKMTNVIHGGNNLTKAEQTNIIDFLHTLTDSTFITNKANGNPF